MIPGEQEERDEIQAENARLKRIIAKELTENDALGAEFVYVNALRVQLAACQKERDEWKCKYESSLDLF